MKRFIRFFRKPAACAVLAGFALVLLAGAARAQGGGLPVIRLAFSRSIDDLRFLSASRRSSSSVRGCAWK